MITKGNISTFSFYVRAFDTKNSYRNYGEPATQLSLEQAKEEFANAEIAEYLSSSFSGKYDSRFSVFGNSEQLEMLAHAAQRVEDSLSETESKLRNSGLVYGDSNSIRDKSADIKSEIDHHNRIEDEGLAPDDGLSL